MQKDTHIVYEYKKHDRQYDVYPHEITFRLQYTADESVETILAVIRGHRLMVDKVREANTWLEKNVRGWQAEYSSSQVHRYFFARKSDAMLFKMVIA